MYCGTCLRDNTVAAELMARGHDVSLLPVYTPTRTDERNVSDGHVFFGGISVFLQQRVPLFRKTPAVLDFLWDVPAVIKTATGRGVSVDPKDLAELTVSMLRGEAGFQAKEIDKLIAYLKKQPPYDLGVAELRREGQRTVPRVGRRGRKQPLDVGKAPETRGHSDVLDARTAPDERLGRLAVPEGERRHQW